MRVYAGYAGGASFEQAHFRVGPHGFSQNEPKRAVTGETGQEREGGLATWVARGVAAGGPRRVRRYSLYDPKLGKAAALEGARGLRRRGRG